MLTLVITVHIQMKWSQIQLKYLDLFARILVTIIQDLQQKVV